MQSAATRLFGTCAILAAVLGWTPSASAQEPAEELAAVRYNPNGTPDATFGDGGKVRLHIPPGRFRSAGAVVDAGNRVLVAGTTAGPAGDIITVVRLTPNGSLDATFGDGGVVRTDLSTGTEQSRDIVLDRFGRLVVAAQACCQGERSFIVLLRYLPDGTLDSTFSDDGIVFSTFTDDQFHDPAAVAVDPFGRIVVAGKLLFGGNEQVGIARFTNAGHLDPTFHGDGRLATDLFNGATAVTVDALGRITVAGPWFTPTRGLAYMVYMLLRLLPSGAADSSFGNGGVTFTDMPGAQQDVPRAVAIHGAGLVAAGSSFWVDVGEEGIRTWTLQSLARYSAVGGADPGFGAGGYQLTFWPGGSLSGRDVKVDGLGRIVVGAQAFPQSGTPEAFFISRYLPDGNLDNAFGTAGMTLTSFGEDQQTVAAMGLDSLGRAVLVGHVSAGGTP
jgi:uncharacterized delta-60 repeat protein